MNSTLKILLTRAISENNIKTEEELVQYTIDKYTSNLRDTLEFADKYEIEDSPEPLLQGTTSVIDLIRHQIKKEVSAVFLEVFPKLEELDVLLKQIIESVESGDEPDFIEAAFSYFVPSSGPAETIAGEVLRAASKVGYRWYNDGDYFYGGYGLETAGPAAVYLMSQNKTISNLITHIAADSLQRDCYEKALGELNKAIEKYLLGNKLLFIYENTEDMWDFDTDIIKELVPSENIYVNLSYELINMLDYGIIDTEDIEDEIEFEFSMNSRFNINADDFGIYVSKQEVLIEGLDMFELDEIEDLVKSILNSIEEEHLSELEELEDEDEEFEEEENSEEE